MRTLTRAAPLLSRRLCLCAAGGGWCYDKTSCSKRSSDQRSSKKWVQSYSVDGVLDSEDPRWADANLAYVGYCTSDAYSGDAPTSSVGFAFMGRSVVDAVFADLVAREGLGAAPGTDVLYSGCSAGARGAMFNGDRVGAFLAAALGDNLRTFRLLLDSAFYVDLEPFDASLPSLMYITAHAYDLANMAATAMPDCAAVYAGDEAWKCFFGMYALPFVKSSYFLNAFLYDSYQLTQKDGIPGKPKTPAETAYVESFRNLTHTYAALDVPATGAFAVTLPACHLHCFTQSLKWRTLAVDGFTAERAVVGWYYRDAAVPRHLEDSCDGYNCGSC